MWNQHKLHRICPRCESHKNRIVPPKKIIVDGAMVSLVNGMKTTQYHCEECDFVWEEAD